MVAFTCLGGLGQVPEGPTSFVSGLLYSFPCSVFGSVEQRPVRKLLLLFRCQEKEAEGEGAQRSWVSTLTTLGQEDLSLRHFRQPQGWCPEPPTPLPTLPWLPSPPWAESEVAGPLSVSGWGL